MVASNNKQENSTDQKSTTSVPSPANEDKTKETNNKASKTTDDDLGYHVYPERQGYKPMSDWASRMLYGRSPNTDKLRCEKNVYKCIERSPIVKLMLSALSASGCKVDVSRHICCEECLNNVGGGYDPKMNQVVVCHNQARSEGVVQGVLAHELIHMFDQCRVKMDLNNLDHLACTEIRAANILHCSFMSSVVEGYTGPFKISRQHEVCVKGRALASILAVRKVSKEEAMKAIDRVFTRCYNDLEPVGRRIRKNSQDMEKAFQERYHYDYGD